MRLSFEGKNCQEKSVCHTYVRFISSIYIYVCEEVNIHILFKNTASNMESDGYFPTLKRKIMKTPQSKEKQFKVHGKPAMILQKHPPYIVGSWGSNRDPNQEASFKKNITQSGLTIPSNHQQANVNPDVFHQFSGPLFLGALKRPRPRSRRLVLFVPPKRISCRPGSASSFPWYLPWSRKGKSVRFLGAKRVNPPETCLNKIAIDYQDSPWTPTKRPTPWLKIWI